MLFKFKDREFNFTRCVIFGILNVTPDSFSDGGNFINPKKALQHAVQLEKDGADAIDIGGESTRPGSQPISTAEELARVLPVIQLLKKNLKIPLSIDTTKSEVAHAVLNEGAEVVNDISGLRFDPKMAKVITDSKAGVILMHSRGTPANMQSLCQYSDVVQEVKSELLQQVQFALDSGISKDRIAIDPGIGFAKTREQNLQLLRSLKTFCDLGYPVMLGVSRKSFLGGTIESRGPATLTTELEGFAQRVKIIRTHDVAALRKALG